MKTTSLIFMLLLDVSLFAADFKKDDKAMVPQASIYLSKETEKEIFAQVQGGTQPGAKKVQATFTCNFGEAGYTEKEKARVCTLQVIRPTPN